MCKLALAATALAAGSVAAPVMAADLNVSIEIPRVSVGAPRVTKVSIRFEVRVATTSVASAGRAPGNSAAWPRQRFCSPFSV